MSTLLAFIIIIPVGFSNLTSHCRYEEAPDFK